MSLNLIQLEPPKKCLEMIVIKLFQLYVDVNKYVFNNVFAY